MMQTAYLRERHDFAFRWWFDLTRLRRISFQGLMRSDSIIVITRHRRRHRAHPRQDARQAPSPTAQAPCRQGLRLPSPPSAPAQAPHHPPHRPLWCRAQEPPGTLPLGGRTDALLAQPLPAPEDPLRSATSTGLTSIWPSCSLAAPSSPCVSSANHVQLARTVGRDRRARPLLY